MWKRWVLWVFLLITGLINLAWAVMAFTVAPQLAGMRLAIPLPLLGGVRLLWGVGWWLLVGVCWWHRRRGRRARCPYLPVALGYQAVLWAVRLLAYRSSYARQLWLRNLAGTVLFLLLVAWLASGPPKRKQS